MELAAASAFLELVVEVQGAPGLAVEQLKLLNIICNWTTTYFLELPAYFLRQRFG